MPKIISVHSYRGGTGKSNITANIACALALEGKRVAVVDTDIQSPGIHMIFGLHQSGSCKTLNDYLWGRCPIEDTVYDVTAHLGVEIPGSVFLIPSSVDSNEIAKVISQGYDFSLLNDGFRRAIQSFHLDYLLIDTHPGLNKETFLSIAISNLVLLILRPDRQDFQGTAVTVDVARHLKVRKMMLLLNKILSSMDFAALREKVETSFELPVAGMLPLSEDVVQLASNGVFCLQYPNHPISQEIKQVAMQIMGNG
jgi:MinD-like ATPase involved in chromosome partitioning or flagellar assembly